MTSSGAAATSRFARIATAVAHRPSTYLVLGFGILLLDVVTSPYLLFPILFVIPIGLCAWFCGRPMAYTLAVILPVGRFFIAAFIDGLFPAQYSAANALIRIAVLLLLAHLIARTASQTRQLEHQVRTLESILPMCMGCRKLRDEEGHWEDLEIYVVKHTDSVVSHGLCPECLQRLYGDVLAKKPAGSAGNV